MSTHHQLQPTALAVFVMVQFIYGYDLLYHNVGGAWLAASVWKFIKCFSKV